MSFEVLFEPLEHVDAWLSELFSGAPLLVTLAIAFVLGLRHASDPDHLVAVTSLIAADSGGPRDAARLGGWWGLGHAVTLLLVGIPLILLKSELPPWLESGAERAVGVVILLLALRVIVKWVRGDYRVGAHEHRAGAHEQLGGAPEHEDAHRSAPVRAPHRHLRRGPASGHGHERARTPTQALALGVLHGLAGTGAVVLLLIAAVPSTGEAVGALAVFAPMSIVSMAAFTGAFAWVLSRPIVEPMYRSTLIPALGVFGLLFGLWYAGLT